MNTIEQSVTEHYADSDLFSRIISGLTASGADINNLQADDLSKVEEFHIGGRKATTYAVNKMSLSANQHVLDVGCGIGGTARYIAHQENCTVTGIDLTPEYIEIARKLTVLTRQEHKIDFNVASALNMPFEDRTFDAAITLHVAMNISKREELYKEIARVLKPSATFCIFDVMKKNELAIDFPVPWASNKTTSHLTTPDEMYSLLQKAGFEVNEVSDRTDFAINFFEESLAAQNLKPEPLGAHILMGNSAKEKISNVMKNINNGSIAPIQMLATRLAN